MLKVAGATALSIFLTMLLFFTFYLMAYGIVHGALLTTRRVKEKWKKGEKDEQHN